MPKRLIQIIFILITITNAQFCNAQNSKKPAKDTYDFIPGKTVIFEDDFSNDTTGKFPSKWKKFYTNDPSLKMEVCTVEHDENGNYLNINDEAEVSLNARLKENLLGDGFTIEYDFMPASNNSTAQIEMLNLNSKPKDTKDFYMTFSTGIYINGNGESNVWSPCWKKRKAKMQYPGTFALGKWHHFAVAYKKKTVKFYIDNYHLFTMDSCDQSLSDIILDPAGPLKIRNVRIAVGESVKTFDKLLTEKKFVTHSINFDVNKSTIKLKSMDFITQLAQFMKANPTIKLEIDGHTDNDGDAASNLKLSQPRAEEVKKQLASAGVADNRLTTKGFGASKPLQSNTTPEGKANNRRVEFIKLN